MPNKPKEKQHRRHFTINLTDSESELLYDLAGQTGDLLSVVLRKCLLIVSEMDTMERKRLWINL